MYTAPTQQELDSIKREDKRDEWLRICVTLAQALSIDAMKKEGFDMESVSFLDYCVESADKIIAEAYKRHPQ